MFCPIVLPLRVEVREAFIYLLASALQRSKVAPSGSPELSDLLSDVEAVPDEKRPLVSVQARVGSGPSRSCPRDLRDWSLESFSQSADSEVLGAVETQLGPACCSFCAQMGLSSKGQGLLATR